MAKIKCPNCGEIIEVDPSQVEDLTRQLRDELFAHDLEQRLAEAGHLHEAQLETARTEERREADRRVAEAQAQVAQLQAQLDDAAHRQELTAQQERAAASEELARLRTQLEAAQREQELAIGRERSAAGEERARLQAQLRQEQQARELALQEVRAQAAQERAALQHQMDEQRAKAQESAQAARDKAHEREEALSGEVTRLKAELSAQEQTLRAQGEAELLRATADLERSRDQLEAQLKVEQANGRRAQADLREQMAQRENELTHDTERQLKAKDELIERYRDDIERLRNYRMSLSTKLIGESLEQHCQTEFDRIRLQAYPRAYFEKDNEAVGGTKGDFVFRDYDDEGNELLSVMFEMKNEEEQSSVANRKRNEDHFKKLDADRTKKNCEYAVLVSTLEPDNDFYNAGIADVSWRYPKMYVVRPQCFTTIIGLLKAAALTAQPYRLQLERTKREELDVTRFEDKVKDLVGGIENDYTLASKNYERAVKDIDAIIAKLNDLKQQMGTAAKHLGTASKRGEKLAVKRLTRGNQTMKAAFAEAQAERERLAGEAEDSIAEPWDAADDALDPDEME